MQLKNGGIDIEGSCSTFLRNVLLLRKGDRLLIYTDRAPREVAAKDIQNYAQAIGIETDIFQLQGCYSLSEIITTLSEKIAAGAYDAVCEMSEQYFYPTSVWSQAVQNGCRVYALGPMDTPAFTRCIGEVDHDKLSEFGMILYSLLTKARRVQLDSELGTRISFRMNTSSLIGRILSKLKLTTMSQVWQPSGTVGRGGGATFLGGQLAFLGIPETIEGTAVIDGYMWPPDELGYIEVVEISIWLGLMYYGKCWIDRRFK